MGSVLRGFLEETLVPVLPGPTTPSRTLVVGLLVPGHVQEESQERHRLLLAQVLSLLPGERPQQALPPGGES